jgi:hypothetical protein
VEVVRLPLFFGASASLSDQKKQKKKEIPQSFHFFGMTDIVREKW